MAILSTVIHSCSSRHSLRVLPLDKITMQKAEHAIELSAEKNEVMFEMGQHHLSKSPLRVLSSVKLIGQHLRDGGARGGEGEVTIVGSWHCDGSSTLGSKGTFRNLLLSYQRSSQAPRDPVKVFGIDGGHWHFNECEIAGAGTGVTACGLMEIGGDGEDSDQGESDSGDETIVSTDDAMDDYLRNPVVTIRGCVLQKLPESQLLVILATHALFG